MKLPTEAPQTGSCAACLVCYECCASGWIPGCGGYDQAKGDVDAAKKATSSLQASDAARAQGSIADQIGYVLDPGQTGLIDQRLGAQYEKTVSQLLENRLRAHREQVCSSAKD